MPELPDLYVYAKNLSKHLLNKKITNVMIFNEKKINTTSNKFIESLKDAHITELKQDGKEIKFILSNNNTFFVHLMLMGKFTLEQSINPLLYNKIASIFFEDNNVLTISDEKHFAKLDLNPPPKTAPDALSDDFSYSYFLSLVLASSRKNIKSLLLDQKSIRGIGNAYVDEILYNAEISPKSKTGKIPEDRIEVLFNQIKETLQWGIDSIIYNTPNIITGETRSFMKVHNRRRKQTAKGEHIIVEKVVSKKTYYTYSQKLYE